VNKEEGKPLGQQITHNQRIRKLRKRGLIWPERWVCWENENPPLAKEAVASNLLL